MVGILKCIRSKLVSAGLFIRIGCARPSIVSDAPFIYPDRFMGASYVEDCFAGHATSPLIVSDKC